MADQMCPTNCTWQTRGFPLTAHGRPEFFFPSTISTDRNAFTSDSYMHVCTQYINLQPLKNGISFCKTNTLGALGWNIYSSVSFAVEIFTNTIFSFHYHAMQEHSFQCTIYFARYFLQSLRYSPHQSTILFPQRQQCSYLPLVGVVRNFCGYVIRSCRRHLHYLTLVHVNNTQRHSDR